MPGLAKGAGPRKRKRRDQFAKKLPPLPAVDGEDAAVSDEDVSFFREHGTFAGFLAKMDTRHIDKTLRGGKADDLEAKYEKKLRKEGPSTVEPKGLQLDPVNALPVKTLDGELVYRTSNEAGAAPSSIAERRAAVQKQKDAVEEPAEQLGAQEQGQPADAGVTPEEDDKKKKLTKKQSREEQKKAKRKEKRKLQEQEEEAVTPTDRREDLAWAEEYASAQERRSAMRLRLAEIGSAVLAEPEEQLQKGALKELLSLCSDQDAQVAQLAMLSAMAVFKDICPGYRIRLPTAKESEMRVSKEVKRLRDFEAALLHSYQAYVQLLVKVAKLPARRAAAIRCLCGLLVALPHFNFRESLLAAIIPRMDAADDDISKECCDAVKELFKGTGSPYQAATVEAVQLIADLVRQRRCQLRPAVIETLTALRFDEDLVRASGTEKGQRGHRKPKGKKAARVEKRKVAAQLQKEVEEDVREAEAVLSPAERKRLQSESISAVFETYFRVLKEAAVAQPKAVQAGDGSGAADLGPHPLLTTALAGLAKFSHLISVDFMGDLLEVLRQLTMAGTSAPPGGDDSPGGASPEGGLTVEEQLQCCLVAFQIVKGALDALNIDLRDFYVRLYQLMWELPFLPRSTSSSLGEPLGGALQAMLWETRQLDVARVAGFAKRLGGAALHFCTSGETVPLLLTLRRILQRSSQAKANLLENEGGGGGGLTMYRPEATDPESSGALATCLWELPLLSKHFHPAAARLALEVSQMANSSAESKTLLATTPVEAAKAYSTAQGGFRPGIPEPRKSTRHGTQKWMQVAFSTGDVEGRVNKMLEQVPGEDSMLMTFRRSFRRIREYKENEKLWREAARVQLVRTKLKEHLRLRKVKRAGKSKKVVGGGKAKAQRRTSKLKS